jgi:hypothetical protein
MPGEPPLSMAGTLRETGHGLINLPPTCGTPGPYTIESGSGWGPERLAA